MSKVGSAGEIQRLQWAIRAALSSPLLDDIQGFAWEAVFHFAKGLPLRDPLKQGKTKRLFDAVAPNAGVGWSLKAKQCGSRNSMRPQMNIDFVIQRADIFTKSQELGLMNGLTKHSPPDILGRAIVRLWNAKVREDMGKQEVRKPRLAVLLKSKDRRYYGYFETRLNDLDESALVWQWAAERRRGLQARDSRGILRLKWYPSGTQLFQCLSVPKDCAFFEVTPARVPMDLFVNFIGNLAGLAPR